MILIKPKIVELTKYCIISFRNVQFSQINILMKAKDIGYKSLISSTMTRWTITAYTFKISIFPVLVILKHPVQVSYNHDNYIRNTLLLLNIVRK